MKIDTSCLKKCEEIQGQQDKYPDTAIGTIHALLIKAWDKVIASYSSFPDKATTTISLDALQITIGNLFESQYMQLPSGGEEAIDPIPCPQEFELFLTTVKK